MRPASRAFLVIMVFTLGLAGCRDSDSPARTVRQALAAAAEGNEEAFLSSYIPEDQAKIRVALGVTRGSGWVPEGALRFLSQGETAEVSVEDDLAVVEIAGVRGPSLVCLEKRGEAWMLTIRRAVKGPEGYSCELGSDEEEGTDEIPQ